MSRKEPVWETNYKADESDYAFGGKPSAEFNDLIRDLPPHAKVLDLGCGDGRNAIFLADRGFHVTAIDISKAGIKKLRYKAHKKGLPIATVIDDIRHYEFVDTYDLIIAHGCLHLIERKYWIPLIERIKSHTNRGGYNVIAVFTDRIAPPADLKKFTLGLFHEGELFTYYKDWEIVIQQNYIKDDEHPGGIKHRHSINKIVAKKK
jgi:tellurite methyltransferase